VSLDRPRLLGVPGPCLKQINESQRICGRSLVVGHTLGELMHDAGE